MKFVNLLIIGYWLLVNGEWCELPITAHHSLLFKKKTT